MIRKALAIIFIGLMGVHCSDSTKDESTNLRAAIGAKESGDVDEADETATSAVDKADETREKAIGRSDESGQGEPEVNANNGTSKAATANKGMGHYLFKSTVEWTQPSMAVGFDPSEPYTPVAHYKDSTYLIWVDASQRAWLTQVTGGKATVVPLDVNPDYSVQPDGHHRFSLGLDHNGYIHVTGDMHHYSQFTQHAIQPYPARYQNQRILYWKSKQPESISGGFAFAGGKNSPEAIPGSGFMMGRFFNDNNGELYYSSMVHAYEAPLINSKGQMAVGLYRYRTETKTWVAIGGQAELPPVASVSNVEKVLYWENSGSGDGWFQNYQARFFFDRMNRLHFAVTGNTNASNTGADRLFYAVSSDEGATWARANGVKIQGLPLRGISRAANQADLVFDAGLQSSLGTDVGLAVARDGNVAVSAREAGKPFPTWFVWEGSRWSKSETLSAAFPMGAPHFAFRTAADGLLFLGISPGMLLHTSKFGEPLYAYSLGDTSPGKFLNVDASSLQKADVLYGVFSPRRAVPPSIMKVSFAEKPLPAGWLDSDITKRPNAYRTQSAFADSTFTLYDFAGDGGTIDDLHYTYRPFTCDGTIAARLLSSVSAIAGTPSAGIMIRESVSEDARFVRLGVSMANRLIRFSYRNEAGAYPALAQTVASEGPAYLKLQKAGNVFIAYYSADGKAWKEVGKTEMPLPALLSAGLFSESDQHGLYMQTSSFDTVSVSCP